MPFFAAACPFSLWPVPAIDSSAPAVASVDPLSGLVTAHGPGLARITATCEGAFATADKLIDRVAVVRIAAKEPVTESRLAPIGTAVWVY